MRLEARHDATPRLLPLLAVLLGITPLAHDLTPVALWLDRSADVEGSVQLAGPFAAGAAAWAASRDRRRNMGDLLASTSRNPYLRTLARWLVNVGWMAAFYIALCATYLSITAFQATWGGPDLWPAGAGLVALIVCSAAGFALGLVLRTRFAAPLAAVGTLVVILGVRTAAQSDLQAGIGLLSPVYPGFGLGATVFYAPQPDLSMLKMVCDMGLLAIALGVIAWHFRADRPSIRRAVGILLPAGLIVTAAAVGLDATARSDGHGIVVPAFRDAAADRIIPYTPVCTRTPLPVCVHPAYDGGSELTILATTINKIVAPVLGVPGMPVRAEQLPIGAPEGVQGDPPVLPIQPNTIHGTVLGAPEAQWFAADMALSLFTGTHVNPELATPAQRALAVYLLKQARYGGGGVPADPAVSAAAARFAALTPAARDSWLTIHLAALRAGYLAPADVP
ncbi:MAG: hypothetical protein JO242_10270 [Streptosporangiaceae bacterium]|nr:hypothetical protein [Streptosporangiaceae bacterium]